MLSMKLKPLPPTLVMPMAVGSRGADGVGDDAQSVERRRRWVVGKRDVNAALSKGLLNAGQDCGVEALLLRGGGRAAEERGDGSAVYQA